MKWFLSILLVIICIFTILKQSETAGGMCIDYTTSESFFN